MTPPESVALQPRPAALELETWTVEDRWWTDAPERRHFVAITAPDGKAVTVAWSAEQGFRMDVREA